MDLVCSKRMVEATCASMLQNLQQKCPILTPSIAPRGYNMSCLQDLSPFFSTKRKPSNQEEKQQRLSEEDVIKQLKVSNPSTDNSCKYCRLSEAPSNKKEKNDNNAGTRLSFSWTIDFHSKMYTLDGIDVSMHTFVILIETQKEENTNIY